MGYSIGRERVFPLGGDPTVQDYVAIDPSTITGPIVLRMVFDDATDLLTCSFSLDGGLTFQTPFAPIQAFKLVPDAEVLLGAAALPPVAPPPPPCANIDKAKVKFTQLDSLGRAEAHRQGQSAARPGDAPDLRSGEPAHADLGPQRSSETAYEVPAGAPGTSSAGAATAGPSRARHPRTPTAADSCTRVPDSVVSRRNRPQAGEVDRRPRAQRTDQVLADRRRSVILVGPGNGTAALLIQLGWDGQTAQACADALLSCVASPGRAICK